MVHPDFQSRWLGTSPWNIGIPGHDLDEGWVICLLVLQGEVQLGWPGRLSRLPPASILWLNTSAALPQHCQPSAEGSASALRLAYPLGWVHRTLASLRQELSTDFQSLLLGPYPPVPMIVRSLEAEDQAWARGLMASTLCTEARRLLEGSRMSEFFFRKVLMEARGEEMFCTRTRRLALERVTKVREALLSDLENPPPLEELARICGCHPQYLSRTFSETSGTTISLYLRRLRIERAAELMSNGRMNISEASLEVGYRSLSHFSQAFRAEKGLTPSEWLKSR